MKLAEELGSMTSGEQSIPEQQFLFNLGEYIEKEAELPDPEQEIDRIATRIKETMEKFNRERVIIAVSAGLDSTLLLAEAIKGVGKERVTCLYLPNEFTEDETRELIEDVKNLGAETIEIDLDPILKTIPGYEESAEYARKKLSDSYKRENNDKSKSGWVKYLSGDWNRYAESMRYLFATSSLRSALLQTEGLCRNALVLTAPNRTEKEVGLYTDGGPDCNGDMQPIVHLSKTQVFQLARSIENFPPRILKRVPTGDLKTPPDEVALGAPFPLVDLILGAHLKFGIGRREIISQLGGQFEKYANQLANLGYTDPALVVDNILDAYELSRDKGSTPFKVEH